QLRVQLMRRLEVGRVQRSPIALEAVAQRRQHAIGVHPLTQVAEDLLVGLLPVQGLQPGPLLWLGRADEGKYGLRKDRSLTVKATPIHDYVAVGEEVGFDDGLKGSFAMPLTHTCAPSTRPSRCGARETGYDRAKRTRVSVTTTKRSASCSAYAASKRR